LLKNNCRQGSGTNIGYLMLTNSSTETPVKGYNLAQFVGIVIPVRHRLVYTQTSDDGGYSSDLKLSRQLALLS